MCQQQQRIIPLGRVGYMTTQHHSTRLNQKLKEYSLIAEIFYSWKQNLSQDKEELVGGVNPWEPNQYTNMVQPR